MNFSTRWTLFSGLLLHLICYPFYFVLQYFFVVAKEAKTEDTWITIIAGLSRIFDDCIECFVFGLMF